MTTWTMPAETDPHDCTWMAWPSGSYTLGETAAEAEEARRTWASVANAVAEYEPLHMLVPPQETAEARRRLSSEVVLHEAPLDDAWYRDIGPTFVLGPAGPRRGQLGLQRLGCAGLGHLGVRRAGQPGRHRRRAARTRIDSPMVNEGGGIHTDGAGTFLVTETVQLDPGRNPGLDAASRWRPSWRAPSARARSSGCRAA